MQYHVKKGCKDTLEESDKQERDHHYAELQYIVVNLGRFQNGVLLTAFILCTLHLCSRIQNTTSVVGEEMF